MSPRLRAQSLQLLNNRTGDIHALVRIRQQPPEKAGEDREANELREELANVGLAQSHHAECPDHRNHNQRPEQTRCSGLNSWPPCCGSIMKTLDRKSTRLNSSHVA